MTLRPSMTSPLKLRGRVFLRVFETDLLRPRALSGLQQPSSDTDHQQMSHEVTAESLSGRGNEASDNTTDRALSVL